MRSDEMRRSALAPPHPSMRRRKTLSALLTAFLLAALLLSACGGAGGCAGRYVCTASPAMLSGVAVDAEWIELKNGGGGTLHLMGKDYAVSWELDGDRLTLTQGGQAYDAFLSDGVITASFDGMIYTYVLEGAQTPESSEGQSTAAKLNALQQWWNGDWYGWWMITDASGGWSELNGSWYDCCARVELDAAGEGSVSVWDKDGELCRVLAALDTESAAGRMGALHSTGGYFWTWSIGADDWVMDPGAWEYDKYLRIDNGYYEDAEGSFRYELTLRPWGQRWDDAAADDPNALPGGYYDWYLPLIEAGESMPDKLA